MGVVILPKAYLESRTCINLEDFNGTEKDDGLSLSTDDKTNVQESFGGYSSTDKKFECTDNTPSRLYRGTTYVDGSGKVEKANVGHMGVLDNYNACSRLFGAFVYNSTPDPKDSSRFYGV